MRSISLLRLATVSALAFAPAAFAQDAQENTDATATTQQDIAPAVTGQQDIYGHPVSNQTASGKHWAVVGSATILQPSDGSITGVKDIDGDVAPTISASYFINDNWAVELWGAADKFDHRVSNSAGKVGSVEQQPIALSAQYHFGQADNTFRPFVGVGYYESNFSNEKIDALSSTGSHVGLDKAKGAIGTIGVDMNINSTWFARADARYMHARPELNVAGQGSGEDLKLDPWTVGFGIGARF